MKDHFISNLHITQLFLLTWTIVFWMYHFLTYGKIEGKHEQAMQKTNGRKSIWGLFFGLSFFGWTAVIVLYFFHYNSSHWIWRIALLDHDFIKYIGMALMCLSLVLYIVFTRTVGKTIYEAISEGGKPKLVTTGLYRFSRHPAYLAFYMEAYGVFFIIPNLITLLLLVYTCIVTFGHTIHEEQRLVSLYGNEYEQYKGKVGRFLPKLH